jgi:sugar-specific transcriptional regulator TrmB
MEKLKQFLIDIGLSKSEAEIYTVLSMSPPSTVLEISKNTKMHRPNVYEALDGLVSRGLVFELDRPTKMFAARSPSSLKNYIKRKEFEIDEIIKEYGSRVKKQNNEKIKITKGRFALIETLYGTLESKEDILVYGIPKDASSLVGPTMSDFHKKRIKMEKVMKHIYNSDAGERVRFLNKMPFTEAKMLPPKYDSYATTLICGDKTIIWLWEDEITVIEINDEHISKPYKEYFEILWKKAKVV